MADSGTGANRYHDLDSVLKEWNQPEIQVQKIVTDSGCEKTYTLVSNGPFYVKKQDENRESKTAKNPFYWDEKNVKLDKYKA